MTRTPARPAFARLARGLCLAAAVALAAGGAGARAQEKKDAPKPVDRADEVRLLLARQAAQQAMRAAEIAEMEAAMLAREVVVRGAAGGRIWTEQQFESYFFPQDRSADAARQRLEALLQQRVAEIDRVCRLTDAQKAKLRLLGCGDIKRFFEGYETARLKFDSVGADVNGFSKLLAAVRPLQAEFHKAQFGPDSLLVKALRNVLTAEQSTRFDAAVREVHAHTHRALVEKAVATIERTIPLNSTRRRELIELLTKEIEPVTTDGPNALVFLMARAGQLPEAKLKPLFTAQQWPGVERILSTYKVRLITLQRQGALRGEDVPE